MNKVLDILIPRFITEYVAMEDVDDTLYPVCCLAGVPEEYRQDVVYMCKASSFNFFGVALFPKFGEPEKVDWSKA